MKLHTAAQFAMTYRYVTIESIVVTRVVGSDTVILY
jgi:hypothetical protein